MGLLSSLLGGDAKSKETSALDVSLKAKNSEFSAVTGKIHHLGNSEEETKKKTELHKDRERLIDELYDLETRRHGQEYADNHRNLRLKHTVH